ncbi:MAG: DUF1549 domain-containing protein [Gemmataceae bacterium]
MTNLYAFHAKLCATLMLTVFAGSAFADDKPLYQRIDELIAAKTPDFSQLAAPIATDEEFLRRIYLDLTGTIPSVKEARAFLQDKSPKKREKLIDKLLASAQFGYHMADVFDVLLIERRTDRLVNQGTWNTYLRTSFAKNKPYDQLVSEILAADGFEKNSIAPSKFYLSRNGEPHQITKDVSRLFLGMNLQCAQCHDHPLVKAYRMDHYYGIFAFYNRSYIFNDRSRKRSVYAEKAIGEVSFESVFDPTVKKSTGPRLPDGMPIKEPKLPQDKQYIKAPGKKQAGIPKFSRRDQISKLLASKGNERFRRAAANRFWALLMGRGIVHPVDFDHPENPPSHPELLDLLASEFASMDFDIKSFLKQLTLTKTYQRSSQMPTGKPIPSDSTFALAQLRPLSPEQLAWTTMQATGLTDVEVSRLGKKVTEAAVRARLGRNVGSFVRVFGGQPGDPADLGFQATLDQTLFIRNGPTIRGWLAPRTGTLTSRLLKLKNHDAIAEELFLSILTRRPTAAEKQYVTVFLKRNPSNRSQAFQEMAWALIASAEFRFNH